MQRASTHFLQPQMRCKNRSSSGRHAQAFTEADGDQQTAMAAASVSGAYTRQAIAASFGVPSSTVRRAVRWAEGQKPVEQHCMLARPDAISVTPYLLREWSREWVPGAIRQRLLAGEGNRRTGLVPPRGGRSGS
jgi:hypothetical protein